MTGSGFESISVHHHHGYTEEVRSDIPCKLIFADDIALIAESEEELQEKV